jgi:outer membrane biosynthesis protein TonB
MRSSTTYTRDAALRKLARINRWLIAGSVALTAALSEAAAQAFPGKSTAAKSKGKSAGLQHHASQPSGGSLQPPAQAPSAGGEAQHEPSSGSQSEPAPATPSESPPAQEPAPAQEAAPQESTHEPAPPPRESAPSQESQAPAPAQESAPAQEAPVVSGGS